MNKYIIRERFAPEETYEGWNSYQAVERWAEDRCEKVLIQSDRSHGHYSGRAGDRYDGQREDQGSVQFVVEVT